MITIHGVYYWPTFQEARQWATGNGWPADRIKSFGAGWTVQACPKGAYAGPDAWPGPGWHKPAPQKGESNV